MCYKVKLLLETTVSIILKRLLIIIFDIDKLQYLFWTIKFEINKFFFIIFMQIR
jgi:hypothetical protein